MTAADNAFQEAERLIEQARQKGSTFLDLDTEETRALTTLPDSIKTLTNLQDLRLNNTQVGDAGLKHITALTNLQRLILGSTQVGDAGLKHIAALTDLQALHLANTQVGNAGLKHITALTHLQTLSLHNTQVGDAGLKHITALTHLQNLTLNNTQVGDAGLKHITALTHLQTLYLNNTQVGNAGLKHITALTHLQTLSLNNTQVGDAGLKHIAALTNLQILSLDNTQVGDAGLKHIAALTHLQTLYLHNTRIRDLRPLTRLTKLADQEGASWNDLHFKNTPACDLDPQIKTLSKISNGPERTAALFDYLNGLTDWPPLPEAAKNPIEQTGRGFQYVVDHNGKTAYDRTPSIIGENQKLSQLHQLLCADAATYLRSAPDDDPFYRIITEKVALYQAQLGDGLNAIVPVLLWKAGNDLRLQLAGQKKREAAAGPMANTPALDDQLRILLESIVSLHNAFANLHPEIAPLETAAQDSAERAAQLDKAAIGEIIAALAPQVTLLMENVRNDLADLHQQALGDTKAAMRALTIEDESLKNLIAHVVAQAVIEARDDSFLSKIGGDVRSALVGAGVATLGPEVAAAYPHLVTQLQPFIAQLASAWQGPFTNIDQVVEWVKIRLSLAGDDPEE